MLAILLLPPHFPVCWFYLSHIFQIVVRLLFSLPIYILNDSKCIFNFINMYIQIEHSSFSLQTFILSCTLFSDWKELLVHREIYYGFFTQFCIPINLLLYGWDILSIKLINRTEYHSLSIINKRHPSIARLLN